MACVDCFLWDDAEEARASIYSGCVKRGGAYPDAFCLSEGECDVGAREWLVVMVKFVVVGGSAASCEPAGCGG